MKPITQYDLLISCPGDIVDEIRIIEELVDDFNQQFSSIFGISIQTRYWSKTAYAQSGDKPQKLLNEQFVKKCDAAIAIFWTRFGSSTDDYKSGTEEEIEIMLKSKKQVFLYFCEKPLKPGYKNKQYQLVKAFKKKYTYKGVYKSYDSNQVFKDLFRKDLIQYFLPLKIKEEIQEKEKSNLVLRVINESENLIDNISIQKYQIPNPMSNLERLNRIKEKIENINSIHFSVENKTWSKLIAENHNAAYFLSISSFEKQKILISESTQSKISNFAKNKGMILCNDFFDLNELREDIYPTMISGGHSSGKTDVKGTFEEKQKYNTILELENEIDDYLLWNDLEEKFSNFHMIKLAIDNLGNASDEDIDVIVKFPKSLFKNYDVFPMLDYFTFSNFEKYYSLYDLFIIERTSKYTDYLSSVKNKVIRNKKIAPVFIEEENQLFNEYIDKLEEIFCYDTFIENDSVLIKLHMDSIKQHTAIAFPTPLFINEPENLFELPYKIISRNNPNIVEGKILKQ